MDSDVVLQTANLSVGYGNFVVLGRVNLTIRAGELWFVLGRNGSGKTTLLQALLGLLKPQTGRLSPTGSQRGRIRAAALRYQSHAADYDS